MPNSHDATFYVRIKASQSVAGKVQSIAAQGVTQGRPAVLQRGEIAIKLTVRLPDSAFDAIAPETVVIVPAEMVQQPAVDLELGDAS